MNGIKNSARDGAKYKSEMKSPTQSIFENLLAMPPNLFLEWLAENHAYIIEAEREMVAKAWLAGNKDGWEMNTDWPEHGFAYYDQQYNK